MDTHTEEQVKKGFHFFHFLLVIGVVGILSTLIFEARHRSVAQAGSSPLDTLQPGEWYEVPNSKIRAVIPNPVPPGNAIVGIVKAWNSGAYDTHRDKFIVWGGGHGDYGGNEIYSFDLATLRWTRSWGPSALADIPPLGSTTCAESYRDGAIAARHTYGGLQYLPNVDKLWQFGGSLWCGSGGESAALWTFDFTNQLWKQMATVTPLMGRYFGTGLGVNSAYDPNTGHVFASSPTLELIEYDPIADIWKLRGSGDQKGIYAMTSAIDWRRKKMVSIGRGGCWSDPCPPQGYAFRYDISSPSGMINQERLVTTGANDIITAYAPGFDYDSASDQYVAWKGGADIYTLNPDTMVWTRRPPATTNTVIPTQPAEAGTFGRFRYIPSKNLFILVNSIDEDVYIYKLSQSSGTTTPVPPASTPPSSTTGGTTTGSPVDTTAPVVSVTSPASGATASGTLTISANASDAGGVAGVQFKIDGTAVGFEDTVSPYTLSLDTTTLVDGVHTITATARDKSGNQATSAGVVVTITNKTTTSTTGGSSGGSSSGGTTTTAPTTGVTTTVSQVNIPSGVFIALAKPDRGKGVSGGTKHTTWVHNPINGRLYQTGGDFAGSIGFSSYRQESYSFSIVERLADKTNQNAGWRLEYPYCGPDGGVQPKSPDFVGWTWDSKRKVFWFVPGLSVTPGTTNCAGETTDALDNPKFLMNHLMTFNPFEADLAKRWTDIGKNPGPNYYGTWRSDYDSQTDTIIRLGIDSNSTAVADIYNIQANTWTEYKLGSNALNQTIRIWAEGHATDIPGRAIYTIDGQAGRLFRYNIDAHTITDLGVIPGGHLNVSGSNDTYLAWDSIHKIVFFFRVDNNTLYVYHPDTNTWETIPVVTSPAGLTPHTRHGMVFDPYQNVLVMFGTNDVYTDPNNPDTNMYLYRYAPGGSTQYTVTNPSTATGSAGATVGTGTAPAKSAPPLAVDTTPPTVSVIDPRTNSTISGVVTLTASATDAGGVAGVQFRVNGAPFGVEDTTSPYTQTLDTRTIPNGFYTLTAIARDLAGNKQVSSPIFVFISNILSTFTGEKSAGTAGGQGTTEPASSGGSTVSTPSLGSGVTASGGVSATNSNKESTPTSETTPQLNVTTPQPSAPSTGGGSAPLNPLTYGYAGGGSVVPSSGSSSKPPRESEKIKPFEKSLYLGVKDEEVIRLQQILIKNGYLPAGNDSGYYGTLTQEAVKKFQCAQGIVCSGDPRDTGYGLVGNTTRDKLNESLKNEQSSAGAIPMVSSPSNSQSQASTPTSTPGAQPSAPQVAASKAFSKPLFPGLRDNEVRALQELLMKLGYLGFGSSTGYYGPLTREAVKKFQCAQGIVCSGDPRDTGYGLVGTMTRKKLNEVR